MKSSRPTLLFSLALVASALLLPAAVQASWVTQQLNAPRVVEARAEVGVSIESLFSKAGVAYPPADLLLQVYKQEMALELWAAGKNGKLTKIITYPICAASGELGPKRVRGDAQVPEGFYRVVVFNAWSSFHLSLGLDYPNRSDRILGDRRDPGGDIFIHGDCASIGCLAIEDQIKQLYLMALDTHIRRGLGHVRVHIYPRRMNAEGIAALRAESAGDKALAGLWESLVAAHQIFMHQRRIPDVTVDPKTGAYRVK